MSDDHSHEYQPMAHEYPHVCWYQTSIPRIVDWLNQLSKLIEIYIDHLSFVFHNPFPSVFFLQTPRSFSAAVSGGPRCNDFLGCLDFPWPWVQWMKMATLKWPEAMRNPRCISVYLVTHVLQYHWYWTNILASIEVHVLNYYLNFSESIEVTPIEYCKYYWYW